MIRNDAAVIAAALLLTGCTPQAGIAVLEVFSALFNFFSSPAGARLIGLDGNSDDTELTRRKYDVTNVAYGRVVGHLVNAGVVRPSTDQTRLEFNCPPGEGEGQCSGRGRAMTGRTIDEYEHSMDQAYWDCLSESASLDLVSGTIPVALKCYERKGFRDEVAILRTRIGGSATL